MSNKENWTTDIVEKRRNINQEIYIETSINPLKLLKMK